MDVYGLIGSPVDHSLSPPMHEAAYDALDLSARYVTFEPAPGDLEAAVTGAAALGMGGLNVTVPYKRDVLELVDPDPLAERVGAVNTVDLDGEPTGHNTDVAGAVRALEHHDVSLAGSEAVVLGAGGAGRAVAFGLADAGASVSIANRTASTARSLAAEVPGASGHPLAEAGSLLEGARVLVNATTVGMERDESPIPPEPLHGDLVVMDAVYRPVETRLLRAAAEAGARTIDGAWMLLFQGVEAFERWTGREAPVSAMNEALRSHLGVEGGHGRGREPQER